MMMGNLLRPPEFRSPNHSSSDEILNHPKILIDYHFQRKTLFWIDKKAKKIFSAYIKIENQNYKDKRKDRFLNRKNQTSRSTKNATSRVVLENLHPIIKNGLADPNGLSIDWIHQRVFWTDSSASTIEHSGLDGSDRTILLSKYNGDGLQRPKSLVVNPSQQTLYWSDWGPKARIECSFLDGTNQRIIISNLLQQPSSLVIDYPAEKLYWIEPKLSLVECSNLDGTNRYTIANNEQVWNPISLALFEDNLYWTSFETSQIYVINKLTGKLILGLESFLKRNDLISNHNDVSDDDAHNDDYDQKDNKLWDQEYYSKFDHYNRDRDHENKFDVNVKVFHSLMQSIEAESDPCRASNCSHLCLPNNETYKCLCPFGFSFDDIRTKQKCRSDTDPLLLYTNRDEIRSINLSNQKLLSTAKFQQSRSDNYSIEDQINGLDLNHQLLPLIDVGFISSIDYDPITLDLYWTDILHKSISRSRWNGENQQKLFESSLDVPSGIACDWIAKNIYWTDTVRNVIEVSTMNGSHRAILIWRSLHQPRDLVIDPPNALMFWSQWSNETSSIERSGMDGSARLKLHKNNLTRPYGLAIDFKAKRLYWTDTKEAKIESSFYGNHYFLITIHFMKQRDNLIRNTLSISLSFDSFLVLYFSQIQFIVFSFSVFSILLSLFYFRYKNNKKQNRTQLPKSIFIPFSLVVLSSLSIFLLRLVSDRRWFRSSSTIIQQYPSTVLDRYQR